MNAITHEKWATHAALLTVAGNFRSATAAWDNARMSSYLGGGVAVDLRRRYDDAYKATLRAWCAEEAA